MLERKSLVVKLDRAGKIMMVYAVCDTPEQAQTVANNTNQWNGPEHPLYPLTLHCGIPHVTKPMFPEID